MSKCIDGGIEYPINTRRIVGGTPRICTAEGWVQDPELREPDDIGEAVRAQTAGEDRAEHDRRRW